MTALMVIVGVQAVLLLLLFGATVELHRQVLQLRHHAGLVDNARPLQFRVDFEATDLPIPAAQRLNHEGRAALVILHDGCTTCLEIAQHLAVVKPPERVMVIVEAHSMDDAGLFLGRYGLSFGDNVAYDAGGLIAKRLDIIVTPSAVKFEGKTPVAATTIPSARQLDRLVEWVREPVPQLSNVDGALQ